MLKLTDADTTFLRKHNIDRIYLRMFDVSENRESSCIDDRAVPNASVRIDEYPEYYLLKEELSDIEIVPTVYVTLDALRRMEGYEGRLAENIVTRVNNMRQYNVLPNVCELQLDCDWTQSTEDSFFALCDSVKSAISKLDLPWKLSSTIRLHQLRGETPPVDRGVLMIYNTGSFDDPDTMNSIISYEDVEPYLKRLSSYPLHLDIAYPTYSWQLLFHRRQFMGLLNDVNVADTTQFRVKEKNLYEAIKDVPYNNRLIHSGDLIRCETSEMSEILKIKNMIEQILQGKPHSNILYHFDLTNLSKYSSNEIDSLLSANR